ncbi:hypothetical protein H8A97_12960 [Bradyrhizobium sp. Arg62]|uniref:hypothetical protein n=1 Tax=Bradyrhizobium brasilense TaxID=1419277 RepID=UPI001E489B53|nr:hypothetical protein [Bradyrhizobium brasilense]MCC8945983.1 hypothetical protein [Bradyrhizobium brasilense]
MNKLFGGIIELLTERTQHHAPHAVERAFAAALIELLKSNHRIATMSQALLDAVATLTGNVSTLSTNMVDHDAKMQTLIADLQAALNKNPATGEDPDIARAIDAISQASSGVATVAQQVAAESQSMADAIAAANPAPAPTPAPTDGGAAPATPAAS